LEKFGDPAEAFGWYTATRIPRVALVQGISIENSWMRGPTETDWFYCYDPCTAELTRPNWCTGARPKERSR
jgi:6-hydroxynicotinate 3-monooxygenase